MALFGLTRDLLWLGVPVVGFVFGKWLDNKETERMSMFRDKSSLFGRQMQPGEKPSWPIS